MKNHSKFQALAVSLSLFSTTVLAQGPVTVAGDDTITTTQTRGGIRINNLLANDTDPQGDALTITRVGKPQFGRAVLASGIVTYTPGLLFKGEDTFTYEINDRPNGSGNSDTGLVTIRNPFLLGRGIYAARLSGNGGTHDVSGYLSTNVGSAGDFTSTFQFAGEIFRFKGKFDITGNFSGEIARRGKPAVQIALRYETSGAVRQITGTVTSGAEVVQFIAPRNPWKNSASAPTAGRYTIVLPPPNTATTTPQGNGYAVLTVTKNGLSHIGGKTGDGRAFSSFSYVSPSGTTLGVYGILPTVGSIYGDITFSAAGPAPAARRTITGDLRWFEAKNAARLRFPKGIDLIVPTRGSTYIEPLIGSSILSVTPATGFNSSLTVSAGNLAAPRTERSSVGRRPLAGQYEFGFDNSRRLAARLGVIARTGMFGGAFTDASTKLQYRFNGVFVHSDNKAYGIWTTRTKSGKVELTPDPSTAN